MNQLCVSLLGELVAHYEGSPPIHFTTRKEQELFCLLLIRRERPLPREGLANVLWGDTTTAQSKKYLRTALWHLRTDLGCTSDADMARLFSTSDGWLRIRPDAPIWTDVHAIEQAFEQMQTCWEQVGSPDEIEPFHEAVGLYRGDLLDGWYQDWCLYERERLQQVYFRLVDGLMAICEDRGDFDRGLSLGLRLLAQEPTRECTHRRLMRLYYLSGDRCSALRHYQRCEDALRDELDVAPSPVTQTLYEQIRACTLEASPASERAPTPRVLAPVRVGDAAALRAVLDRLSSIQDTLGTIQEELHRLALPAPPAEDHEAV